MKTVSIPLPDDWHCHLRDGDYLARTVADVSQRFGRVIVMPNLVPPVTDLDHCRGYLQRITENIPQAAHLQPLMTLYLTDSLSPQVLVEGKRCGLVTAAKLYPAGATTHSAQGVTDITGLYPLLDTMQSIDMPLLIHGEVVDPAIDIFDREAVFIQRHLIPILKEFPRLRVVLEHISTEAAVDFVKTGPTNLAATVTAHHLLLNRNDLLAGGLRAHHYCLPILKTKRDQHALIAVAISGHPRFFLGTDSAPHAEHAKLSACGCAGIYTSHAAIELYAQLFDAHNALDRLADFASRFGAEFYGLPLTTQTLTLANDPWQVPSTLTFGDTSLVPLYAGQRLPWRILS